jgi:2-amino-4-hydroxy-6-hydroxymethyldihydropteridine diphosphokinase
LSLGSNLGDRKDNLERALAEIERESIRVIARSSFYETEPQDMIQQPWFLNLAAACQTTCFPLQLLAALQTIERDFGRIRGAGTIPKGPRLLDIDILLYGDVVMDNPQLTIPHPRMLERRFVLEPLSEIAPGLRDPATGRPLREFLSKITDQVVQKL